MRTVFEGDEDERETDSAESARELTLGTGTLLLLFFALVLVCGLCFGLGFSLGEHSGGAAREARQNEMMAPTMAVATGRGAQKPSQDAGRTTAVPETTAAGQPNAAPISDNLATVPETMSQSGIAPAATMQGTGQQAANSAEQLANGAAGRSVHAALPMGSAMVHPEQAATGYATVGHVQAALPVAAAANSAAAGGIMVQVAAVNDPVDARALLDALKKRGYAVTLTQNATDRLMHVQVGPFGSRADALAMRQKLLQDGYNAIVK